MQKKLLHIIFVILGFVLLNYLSSVFYNRWDLTSDKRYSLSKSSKSILNKLDEDVVIKVYLKGDYPLNFKRLEKETKQFLDELKIVNNHIHYRFINPNGKEEKLIKKGLQPSKLTIEGENGFSENLIFPWATISYKGKEVTIPLLINSVSDPEKQLQASIENLEYSFARGFSKITQTKRKTIAILKGNGELEDLYLYDFLKSLKEKYNLAPFTLKNTKDTPKKILTDLESYDLCIIAKPTTKFNEKQKFILDQYIINNGKTLWLVDNVNAEMDSLRNNGEALFINRDLNLTDLLFSYGVRINFNIIQDLYSSKIILATGNVGNKPQFQQLLWNYYPLVIPNKTHPITKYLDPINLKFPSSIDTLPNHIHKTVLLQSSALTRITGLPNIVSISSIAEKIQPENFTAKNQIFGVLLEGDFISAYSHRTLPLKTIFKEKSNNNKMIVISDGDIVANQLLNGQPTRLDLDKWTGQYYGNKDFLLNSVDYLLDTDGLLDIRRKKIELKVLNREKIQKEKGFWQFINILFPLMALGIFGFIFNYFRKKKYA